MPLLHPRLLILAVALMGAGCSGDGSPRSGRAADAAPDRDPPPSNDAGADRGRREDLSPPADTGDMPGPEAGPSSPVCPPAAPARLATHTAELRLPVALHAAGKPLVLDREVVRSDGVAERLLLVRVFLAEPRLLRADGTRVAAQLLDPQGKPAPYGLVLLDAESPGSLMLTLAAPPGAYTGLEFGVGVPEVCGEGKPTSKVAPLNADSDMYWPWGGQYLFVKVEGQVQEKGPPAFWGGHRLHMGMDYRTARLEGPLSAPAMTPGLVLDVDAFVRPDPVTREPVPHFGAPWVADRISAGEVLSFAR
jgi:hypothetical protein